MKTQKTKAFLLAIALVVGACASVQRQAKDAAQEAAAALTELLGGASNKPVNESPKPEGGISQAGTWSPDRGQTSQEAAPLSGSRLEVKNCNLWPVAGTPVAWVQGRLATTDSIGENHARQTHIRLLGGNGSSTEVLVEEPIILGANNYARPANVRALIDSHASSALYFIDKDGTLCSFSVDGLSKDAGETYSDVGEFLVEGDNLIVTWKEKTEDWSKSRTMYGRFGDMDEYFRLGEQAVGTKATVAERGGSFLSNSLPGVTAGEWYVLVPLDGKGFQDATGLFFCRQGEATPVIVPGGQLGAEVVIRNHLGRKTPLWCGEVFMVGSVEFSKGRQVEVTVCPDGKVLMGREGEEMRKAHDAEFLDQVRRIEGLIGPGQMNWKLSAQSRRGIVTAYDEKGAPSFYLASEGWTSVAELVLPEQFEGQPIRGCQVESISITGVSLLSLDLEGVPGLEDARRVLALCSVN